MQHDMIAEFIGAANEWDMWLATHVDREFRSGIQRSKSFADFVCSVASAELRVTSIRTGQSMSEVAMTVGTHSDYVPVKACVEMEVMRAADGSRRIHVHLLNNSLSYNVGHRTVAMWWTRLAFRGMVYRALVFTLRHVLGTQGVTPSSRVHLYAIAQDEHTRLGGPEQRQLALEAYYRSMGFDQNRRSFPVDTPGRSTPRMASTVGELLRVAKEKDVHWPSTILVKYSHSLID